MDKNPLFRTVLVMAAVGVFAAGWTLLRGAGFNDEPQEPYLCLETLHLKDMITSEGLPQLQTEMWSVSSGREIMKNTIKVERAKKDMTQEDLAKAIDVSRQTINSIEKGKYVPSTLLALKIAQVFGTRVDDIFELEEGEGVDSDSVAF